VVCPQGVDRPLTRRTSCHHARPVKRLMLILLAVALLTPALVSASQLAQRRTLRERLAAVGCFDVATEPQSIGSRSVFAVSVSECEDESRAAIPSGAALERIAGVVWSTPAARFDAVSATVYRSQGGPGATNRVFPSDELQTRWGPRASDLDWVFPDLIRRGWFGYLVLPVILMVLAVPVVLGVLAARRGVFVIVFWRG
jgi:hypothetical protein